MKVVIFFEVIISFEIIWNLIYRMENDKLGFIVSAVVLHYINFLIKCILINLESQKWQFWGALIVSESISMGLLSMQWQNKIDLIQVLIVIQCGWGLNIQQYYIPGMFLGLYSLILEFFKQGSSIYDLIKTIIILILCVLLAYKMRPEQHKDMEASPIPKVELQMSIKFDIKNHILELVPWLTEQKFIVFNDKMLMLYEQAQLLQFFDSSVDEGEEMSDSKLVKQLLDCKCDSLSTGLLKLLQGPQPKKRAFLKPDLKSICQTLLENGNSIYNYYSAGEIESKQFKLQNFKFNFIILSDISQFENILILHIEQQLERKNQFSKSLHTISVHQNHSSANNSKTVDNNTISSSLLYNIFQSVSHEFGTYLNCIMTVSREALNSSIIKKEIKEVFFDPIQINSQLLNYILRNIRDYNSILLQQFTLKLQEFSPYQTIMEIINLMDKQLNFRSNTVKVDCPVDLKVYNDAERYKQIIYQLLSNSARFTSEGTITIEVTLNQDKLKTKITDTGIGMSISESQKLSEMLKDNKKMLRVSSNSVGCGLGLSISNAIVQKMHGKKGLEFKSTQNKGTEFQFSIRNSQQLYNESAYQTSQTYLKIVNQIYYVEQQPSEASIKQMLASKYEASLRSQSNSGGMHRGQRHIKSFSIRKHSAETQQQFLHRITDINQIKQDIDADQNDDEEEEENENDPSLYKQSLIVIPSLETNFKTQIVQYNISSKCCSRVLIVDDEVFNIISMQLILSKFSVKSDKACNGIEAIRKCEEKKLKPCKICSCQGYAAIFLDINMPLMNGIDTVRIIKKKINEGSIPRGLCIANTGYCDFETKKFAIAQGMDYYFTKPIDVKELESYLKTKFPINQ
ncbi:unnamed protein product [Paramecium octaurelia]|uniref:Uncharacterized protein n=1 Tax=Paramecium octaurelia TaxID=43137 RepID=A0A8S1SWW0_PAROT|nr:unnamed protein product [Paramecium octaurelia]